MAGLSIPPDTEFFRALSIFAEHKAKEGLSLDEIAQEVRFLHDSVFEDTKTALTELGRWLRTHLRTAKQARRFLRERITAFAHALAEEEREKLGWKEERLRLDRVAMSTLGEIVLGKIPWYEMFSMLERVSKEPATLEELYKYWSGLEQWGEGAIDIAIARMVKAMPEIIDLLRFGFAMPTVLTAFADPTLLKKYPPLPDKGLPAFEPEIERYVLYPGSPPPGLLEKLGWLKRAVSGVTTLNEVGGRSVCTAWLAGFTAKGEPLFVTAAHCLEQLRGAPRIVVPGVGEVAGEVVGWDFEERTHRDCAVIKLPPELREQVEKTMKPLEIATVQELPTVAISGVHAEIELAEERKKRRPAPLWKTFPLVAEKVRGGYSGAPWLKDGKVMGVLHWGFLGYSDLTRLSSLHKVLKQAGLASPALPDHVFDLETYFEKYCPGGVCPLPAPEEEDEEEEEE